jgi:hypothetical protein
MGKTGSAGIIEFDESGEGAVVRDLPELREVRVRLT